jgi:hypothetical protein
MFSKCVELSEVCMFDCMDNHSLLSRIVDGNLHGHPEAACLGFFGSASSKMAAAEALYALCGKQTRLVAI